MQDFWTVVTHFGDSSITLPLAAAMGVWAVAMRWWRGAAGWALAIGAAGALLMVLKLVFRACGPTLFDLGDTLTSPSGHAGMSAAIYGVFALTMGASGSSRLWRLAPPAALVGIALIAVSRLVLGMHSLAEVAVGLAVGALAVAIFHRVSLRGQPAPPVIGWLVLACAAIVAIQYGVAWPIEGIIRHIAQLIRGSVAACM